MAEEKEEREVGPDQAEPTLPGPGGSELGAPVEDPGTTARVEEPGAASEERGLPVDPGSATGEAGISGTRVNDFRVRDPEDDVGAEESEGG